MTIKEILKNKDYKKITDEVIEECLDDIDLALIENILWNNDIYKCDMCGSYNESKYIKLSHNFDGYICESCLEDNDL